MARKRIRRKPGNKVVLALRKTSDKMSDKSGSTRSLTVPSTNELVTNFSSEVSTSSPNASPDRGAANNNGSVGDKVDILPKKRLHQRESIEAKRERKAAKTLAIITGAIYTLYQCFTISIALYVC